MLEGVHRSQEESGTYKFLALVKTFEEKSKSFANPYGKGEIGGVVLDTPLCAEQAAALLAAYAVGGVRAILLVRALGLPDPVARVGRVIHITGLATPRAF